MPKVDVRNLNNETVGSIELSDDVFNYPYKEHLVHEAVRNHLAALRAGTHKTKVRSEVSGSGKKPFRQKGTGRARQGGNRPPIHRHGGTVFGPQPRDYSYKMNVREKKNALRSALSQRLRDGRLLIVDQLTIDQPKTKVLAEKAAGIGLDGKALFVDSIDNVNLFLASRNNPRLLLVDASHVNVYDVINSQYVVLSREAVEKVTEVLG